MIDFIIPCNKISFLICVINPKFWYFLRPTIIEKNYKKVDFAFTHNMEKTKKRSTSSRVHVSCRKLLYIHNTHAWIYLLLIHKYFKWISEQLKKTNILLYWVLKQNLSFFHSLIPQETWKFRFWVRYKNIVARCYLSNNIDLLVNYVP